jgi:hypothetical protein
MIAAIMKILWRASGVGLLAGAASFLVTTGAFAQVPGAASTPPPAAAQTTESAPPANSGTDIVHLKNGGVVRGKISELLPGTSVTIISASGKTHEFQMSEVSYAGPESRDPTAAPQPAPASAPAPAPAPAPKPQTEWSNQGSAEAKPYVTVHGERADLRLESDPPGLTFHRESSSAIAFGHGGVAHATGYERLCTSPCSISLPAGTESFALSIEGKSPVSAGTVTFPAGTSTLKGTYNRNTGIRIAGGVVIAASVIAGVALLASASKTGACDEYGYCHSELNTTNLIAGSVILGAGVGLGIGLVFVPDSGKVQAIPNGQLPEPVARVKMPTLGLRTAF